MPIWIFFFFLVYTLTLTNLKSWNHPSSVLVTAAYILKVSVQLVLSSLYNYSIRTGEPSKIWGAFGGPRGRAWLGLLMISEQFVQKDSQVGPICLMDGWPISSIMAMITKRNWSNQDHSYILLKDVTAWCQVRSAQTTAHARASTQ